MRTIAYASHILVGEDSVLTKIGPTTSLLNESGGQTVGEGHVVGELSIHVVPKLYKRQHAAEIIVLVSHVVLGMPKRLISALYHVMMEAR